MKPAARSEDPQLNVPTDDLVGLWWRRLADAEFVINDDEVHCLQEAAMNEAPESVACLMLRKLAKARLHHRYRMPLDVAALNCIVEYRLGDAKPERRRLVHPRAVRLATDLNVASVLGAGLIGMRAGQQVQWPDPQGIWTDLKLLSVAYEAAQPADSDPGARDC